MPGVNLDFLPASQAPEVPGSPDSTCAESGLEEVIGDLLVQDEEDEEEEPLSKSKFELTLRCAVGEIHSDLKAFGKRVDARLEEASAKVAPLAEALARLQEENSRLKIQQERLVKQVEVLCRTLGLQAFDSEGNSPPDPCDAKTSTNDSQTSSNETATSSTDSPHEKALETPQDASNSAPNYSASTGNATQSNTASNLRDKTSCEPQESKLCTQDSESVSNEEGTPESLEPSLVQHPPTFATRRSLSAPSLMAAITSPEITVPLSVNSVDHKCSV